MKHHPPKSIAKNFIAFVMLCLPMTSFGNPSESLRSFIEGLNSGAEPVISGHRLLEPADLSLFYRNNRHLPVWSEGKAEARRLQELVTEIRNSQAHGLIPDHYHLEALEAGTTSSLTVELLATDAFLAQVRHRVAGAVSPHDLDPDWHLPRMEADPGTVLENAVSNNNISSALSGLWPQHREYHSLVAKRAELISNSKTDTVVIPPGAALKFGQSNERVLLLKQRLLGPGEHTMLFDEELEKAVIAFQIAAGLDSDGIVGTASLEVLNATHFSWIDRIDANLERWRWLPHKVPDTYIRVNIAAFQLRVIEDGMDVSQMKIIVGRPYRRTPVFSESIKYMVYNPYWNVPYKLATKDKLPLLKQDSSALAAQGYEVMLPESDEFVPVTSVDWQAVTARQFNYLLRQKPGKSNALGRIKFMLPNTFSVYLHDTPDHSLFSKQERGFSSGCIRLSDPLGLASWILKHDQQLTAAETLQQDIERGETRAVYLKSPLPVMIVYFTAFVDERHEVVFRRDLYERDQAIIRALHKTN